MLKGKRIVLGVSGGIAAYKMADVASMLVKLHADVRVVMTKNACHFITPETFETLTGNHVYVDVFDTAGDLHVPHVNLGTSADCILVAPASADVIGKICHGIADDMLTTTVLPATCPVLLAPSMNVHMYANKIVQDNMTMLASYGYRIIEADTGFLACREEGKGKLPQPSVLVEHILLACAREHDLAGKNVLVTAGATKEAIDPVRYITNHSTGKMGYAVAKMAAYRGAKVTLVAGDTALDDPVGVHTVHVKSAADMFTAVKSFAEDMDIIIKAAAVADYTPKTVAENKIKKKDTNMSIELDRTKDILAWLGENKRDDQFICGFSMETENLIENSRAKLIKKNVDMIAANSLKTRGAGFAGDTNVITVITGDSEKELPLLTKEEAADRLLDEIIAKELKRGKNE